MSECAQIFSTINMGLVTLDQDMVVLGWNNWMAHFSGYPEKEVVGRKITDLYPNLAQQKYRRSIESVFRFGNYAYFSQKLHRFLFKMRNPHQPSEVIEFMQQSCAAGPIRDQEGEITQIFIAVEDVTEMVTAEILLKEKIRQLEEALATVKTLQGVIPICMYCKKIRNDEESWQHMERYISEHSLAQFSHGICPECYKTNHWEDSEA